MEFAIKNRQDVKYISDNHNVSNAGPYNTSKGIEYATHRAPVVAVLEQVGLVSDAAMGNCPGKINAFSSILSA